MPQAHFVSPLLNEYVERSYPTRLLDANHEDDRTEPYYLDDVLVHLRSHQYARIVDIFPGPGVEPCFAERTYTIEYTQSPYPRATYFESELADNFSRSTNR